MTKFTKANGLVQVPHVVAKKLQRLARRSGAVRIHVLSWYGPKDYCGRRCDWGFSVDLWTTAETVVGLNFSNETSTPWVRISWKGDTYTQESFTTCPY